MKFTISKQQISAQHKFRGEFFTRYQILEKLNSYLSDSSI